MSATELPTSVKWPEDWRNVPLWALFDRIKDVGHPDEEMLSVYRAHGVIKKSSRDDNTNQTAENRNIYQLVDDGWLIVNRMKAWQGSVGISSLHGIVSGHYLCFRPRHSEDPRFLNWLLRSDIYATEYARMSRGVRPGQIEIDNDELRGLRVALPPFDEQRRIADFLDAETARIDRMIQIRRASRVLVEEKAFCAIAALATVGKGPRRATGNLWIPETGAGWDVVSLKRRWRVIDCKHRTPAYVDDGYPVVSPGDVSPGRLDVSVAHRFVGEDDFLDLADSLRRARRGDIVYGRNASVGVAAYVDTDEKFTMGQDVCRITSADQEQLFLAYFLNTAALAQLGSLQIGSTFTRINIGTLLELNVACPPREVQRKLAAEMDEIASNAASTRASIDDQLALLSERQQALITAAVTGQIDVTTARGLSSSGGAAL